MARAPMPAAFYVAFASTLAMAAQLVAQQGTGSEGQALFLQHCSRCHGVEGGGGEGPSLKRARLKRAETDEDLSLVITDGIPEGGMPGSFHLAVKDVSSIVGYVRSLGRASPEPLPGDPERGAEVYSEWGCEACHVLAGVGRHIGPELTEIGIQRGLAHLRESLLDPAASLPDRYMFLRARRAEGGSVEGLLVNEDAFTIQLRDANGRFHSFEKSQLSGLDRMRKRSIMRTYRGKLTSQELDDLVSFLASRRGPDEDSAQETIR